MIYRLRVQSVEVTDIMQQNSGLLSQMDRLSLQSPLRLLSVFVFYLLLAHSCRGQSQLIGPLQPIVARVGDDIILPCHLKPAVDVVAMTLEWKRPDLVSEFVLVWRDGQDFVNTKNPSYKERSSLFIDELKRGNLSLKLFKVQLSDQGTYECYIPDLDKQSLVKLVVVESELFGSPQQIVATVGDDVILPCHLEPAVDVAARTLEWTRPDLNHRSVHVWRDGQDLIHVKDPSYTGRTSLFTDELKHGNISLKLSKVKPSDEGRYQCGIPDMNTDSFIELVVASGAASYPVITLAGIDKATRGVMLDCRSEGWYPEPEVLWLDGEGNLLSAGPPETVRGPDDLYTVSSRVTVEKRHSNSFTCRVQQKNTNQTRETHIQVPDDFFKLQSSSVPVITGLAVSLAVCILLLLFVLWKWRQIIIKTKRNCRDQTEKGEKKKHSETNKSGDQCVTEEREREQLMKHVTVEMEVLKGNEQQKIKHFQKKRSEQQLQEEKRREEQQKKVETLKEELLETKKNEIETKRAELQQLHEEKKRNENELQSLKEELKKKNKELERLINASSRSIVHSMGFSNEKQLKTEEVETLKKKLENQQKESDANIQEFKEKTAEIKQLQDQIQRMETNLQTLMEDLKSNNMELERSRAAAVRSSSSGFKWPIVSRQKIQDEQQRRREAENRVQILEEELQTKNREFNKQICDEQQKKEEAERDLKELIKIPELEDKQQADKIQLKTNEELKETKHHLEITTGEISQLKRQIRDQKLKHDGELNKIEKKLQEEKTKREKAEKEVEKLKKEMEDKSSSTTESLIVVEVNQHYKHVRLINKSPKDHPLGGWRLEMQINRKPISYTFESSFKLKSGSKVTMCGTGWFQRYDLWWKDFTPWSSGDSLRFFLISDTGVRHQLSSYSLSGC